MFDQYRLTGGSSRPGEGTSNDTVFGDVLALFLVITNAFADATVPLPENVEVFPPDSDVPAELSRWSGKWEGSWGSGELPHILVVEEVEASGDAVVVYAVGESKRWDVEPRWERLTAKLSADGKQLDVKFPIGAEASYKWKPNYLDARFVNSQGRVTRGRITKAK